MKERERRVLKLGISALVMVFAAGHALAAGVYCIEKDPLLYGYLNQHDIGGAVAPVACGPASAVNSLVYLQNRYPSIHDQKLIPDTNGNNQIDYAEMVAVGQTLANANHMNTQAPGGTFTDNFLYGKQLWMETQAAGLTVYEAQSPWGWTHDPATTVPAPSWIQDTYPTWDFLYDELVDCEDVEILIEWEKAPGEWTGHYLTLTSFCWTDDCDDIIEPGEATIGFVDCDPGGPAPLTAFHVPNAPLWQRTDGILATSYREGYDNSPAIITFASSQSPIPEPVTVLGLFLGLSALFSYVRSRHAARD